MRYNIRIVFAVVTTLLFRGVATAQINESDTLKFQIKTSLTGNYQTGNIEVLTIKGKLDLAAKLSKDFVYKSQNSTLYQEFYNKEADNDIFSRNYVYYRPQNKVYPYAIGYVSTNYRRKVDLRYFAGAGVTYQLIQTKNNVLKLSGNIVYEQTKFNATAYNDNYYNGTNRIKLWRASAFISGWSWILENHLRLSYDAYWQPALDHSKNYRTQMDLGLDFPIWKGLSATALYTYTHENVVPITTKTTDNILTFGFNYALKTKK